MNDTMTIIKEAVAHVYSEPVREWKENGGKVVANLCTFVPSEVLHAGGILPIRFRGVEAADLDVADAYYGPFICSCPKAILQMICEGRYSFLDGAVITPGCDSMRRLDDCWQKAAEDFEGIMPPFFCYLGVPHKASSHAMEWFIAEIRRFIKNIEDHFQVEVTDDKLTAAIKTYNRGRELMYRLQKLRMQDEPAISGTDAFAIIIAGAAMPREAFNTMLESILTELETTPRPLPGDKKRLLVVGSVCDDTSLIELVEAAGAVVVSDNLCFGARHTRGLVAENGDPVAALADWYLGGVICPRMFGSFESRLANIEQQIEEARVDGVVMQNIRFCDLHGAENGLFAKRLKEMGVPSLEIEVEYGPLVDTGRVKMRVDAFLERIS
ncbi:MAG: 2-hydroxyacyl-CoA dehydratase family protein [Thermodesulfobacteriota bacterium]|nr:2-hydroxyacyl-CoA dehydratase family protein [Thermodesulfobacteriota bacterium]